MHYDQGVPRIPAAALAVPDAELLHRLISGGETVRIRLTLGCRRFADAESANVIGDVMGREKPEEIVLLGAHLDSWDLGTGALDDGAGVGIVLEAGRAIGALNPHPRRTVRVVLYANEEFGLSGANAYAEAHREEVVRHVVALESDHGTGKASDLVYAAGPQSEKIVEDIAAPLRSLGVNAPQAGTHQGADLSPLRRLGVPLVQVQQEGLHYFDYHHSADDTFDKIIPAELAQASAAVAVFAYGAAEAEGRLSALTESQRQAPAR
jgi:Zn-dependent M28 family amino/carboxypeptidase